MSLFERMMVPVAIKSGWFKYSSIEWTLPSGRKFRYEMQDYPFRVFASDAELEALCYRIINDKYRYCKWDRKHPRSESEVEIFDAIKKWMMGQVAKARELQAAFGAAKAAQPENVERRTCR